MAKKMDIVFSLSLILLITPAIFSLPGGDRESQNGVSNSFFQYFESSDHPKVSYFPFFENNLETGKRDSDDSVTYENVLRNPRHALDASKQSVDTKVVVQHNKGDVAPLGNNEANQFNVLSHNNKPVVTGATHYRNPLDTKNQSVKTKIVLQHNKGQITPVGNNEANLLNTVKNNNKPIIASVAAHAHGGKQHTNLLNTYNQAGDRKVVIQYNNGNNQANRFNAHNNNNKASATSYGLTSTGVRHQQNPLENKSQSVKTKVVLQHNKGDVAPHGQNEANLLNTVNNNNRPIVASIGAHGNGEKQNTNSLNTHNQAVDTKVVIQHNKGDVVPSGNNEANQFNVLKNNNEPTVSLHGSTVSSHHRGALEVNNQSVKTKVVLQNNKGEVAPTGNNEANLLNIVNNNNRPIVATVGSHANGGKQHNNPLNTHNQAVDTKVVIQHNKGDIVPTGNNEANQFNVLKNNNEPTISLHGSTVSSHHRGPLETKNQSVKTKVVLQHNEGNVAPTGNNEANLLNTVNNNNGPIVTTVGSHANGGKQHNNPLSTHNQEVDTKVVIQHNKGDIVPTGNNEANQFNTLNNNNHLIVASSGATVAGAGHHKNHLETRNQSVNTKVVIHHNEGDIAPIGNNEANRVNTVENNNKPVLAVRY